MQVSNSTLPPQISTTNSATFLEFDGVSKIYPTAKGSYTVLEDVNLNIQEGEFICLIGHSGCGKSTLLSMVSGLNKPSSGQIRLKNQPITKPGPDRMVIFQNYSFKYGKQTELIVKYLTW